MSQNNRHGHFPECDTRLGSRVYYEVVSSCNLRCVHCNDLFHAQGRELSQRDVLDFHAYLSEIGTCDSVITGGEPTLHSEFDKLVAGLSKYGAVTVTTNGLAFPTERASRLLRQFPRLVFQVSFDGINRMSFEAMRGRNTFEKVVRFVDNLSGEGLSGQIGLSMTVTAYNAREIQALLKFAEERGIRSVHFPQLVPVGLARANWNAIALDHDAQVDIERQILACSVTRDSNTQVSTNRLERIAAWLLLGKTADCLRTLSLRVTPDGKIVPCPTASADSWSLGMITDRPQPERLLSTLAEQGELLRRFATMGNNRGQNISESRPDVSCIRTCESCWLLGPPDPDIAVYGARVNEQHIRDATNQDQVENNINTLEHTNIVRS